MKTNTQREVELLHKQKEVAQRGYNINNPVKSRLAPQTAQQRKVTMEEIKTKIDKETLFLLAFVPFVIAEVAWDYADTCLDIAVVMRQHATKKLCQRIRQLRKDYDYIRYHHIDREHREIENDNMLLFQENYKEFFNKLHINIKGQTSIEHPGLDSDSLMLITSAYSCAVVLRALFKYMTYMEKRVADLLGITAIGSLVIKEIRELEKIILQFAGEDSIGNNNQFPAFLNPFVDTLCNYMKQSEMVELPCPID